MGVWYKKRVYIIILQADTKRINNCYKNAYVSLSHSKSIAGVYKASGCPTVSQREKETAETAINICPEPMLKQQTMLYGIMSMLRHIIKKKTAKTNNVVAIKAIAHKLARACYYIIRDQKEFDPKKAFA